MVRPFSRYVCPFLLLLLLLLYLLLFFFINFSF
jgi:hypothetical protein